MPSTTLERSESSTAAGDGSRLQWRSLSHWLFQRQTLNLYEEEVTMNYGDEESEGEEANADAERSTSPGAERVHVPDPTVGTDNAYESIKPSEEELQYTAFNGRCNKIGDTCYAFWVGGTLDVSLLLPSPSFFSYPQSQHSV